jgi:hypothetical protein
MTLIAITMDDDTAAISPYSHFHQEFRRVLHLDARLRLLLHALPSAMSAALESTTGSPDGFPPEDCKVQWGVLTRQATMNIFRDANMSSVLKLPNSLKLLDLIIFTSTNSEIAAFCN